MAKAEKHDVRDKRQSGEREKRERRRVGIIRRRGALLSGSGARSTTDGPSHSVSSTCQEHGHAPVDDSVSGRFKKRLFFWGGPDPTRK